MTDCKHEWVYEIVSGRHCCRHCDIDQKFPIKIPYGVSQSIKRSELRDKVREAEHKSICSSAAPITDKPCHICGATTAPEITTGTEATQGSENKGLKELDEKELLKTVEEAIEEWSLYKHGKFPFLVFGKSPLEEAITKAVVAKYGQRQIPTEEEIAEVVSSNIFYGPLFSLTHQPDKDDCYKTAKAIKDLLCQK